MDYQAIEQVMSNKGFLVNPAFQDLTFLIEDIPCADTCPLGLYFPDTATIVIPPSGDETTLLHELGHRYGHYYYNNLSEGYAEVFRKKYQNGRVLLYAGSDFGRLPKLGKLFSEGEEGAIEVALTQPLTLKELDGVMDTLYYHGICLSEAPPRACCGNSEIPWVRFEFTRGVDWVTIIGASLAATVVAGVGAIGYAIYKTSKETPWVVPVALAGIAAIFLLRAAAKQAKKHPEWLRVGTA